MNWKKNLAKTLFFQVLQGLFQLTRKADLPYTNAFIQEVYRYRTLTPLGVPHKANVDTQMDGYVIPENTQVSS